MEWTYLDTNALKYGRKKNRCINVFHEKPRNLHWFDSGQLHIPTVPMCLFTRQLLPNSLLAVLQFALPQIWIFITDLKLFQFYTD